MEEGPAFYVTDANIPTEDMAHFLCAVKNAVRGGRGPVRPEGLGGEEQEEVASSDGSAGRTHGRRGAVRAGPVTRGAARRAAAGGALAGAPGAARRGARAGEDAKATAGPLPCRGSGPACRKRRSRLGRGGR